MATHRNALAEGYTLKGPQYEYVIERVLGSGGFGITYLASATIKVGNVEASMMFAIKEHFMSGDCERDPQTSRVMYSNPVRTRVEGSRKDFIAEARRLHKVGVTHPNIVKVNEVFEANNTAYYVMEYLNGQSLRSYVREHGPLSEEEMHAIMDPIADAVKSLHAVRMTHLDIKPDNIMLAKGKGGTLRPVLIDFGLSKHYDQDGHPTSTINTLGCSDGYAPMEQYSGITTFSPGADIYALGATMAFCLTGTDPKKSTELYGDTLGDELPANVSPDTRAAIAAMTAAKPAQRTLPGTAAADATCRVPTSDPVPPRHAAAAANATQTLGDKKPRRRWLIPAAIAAILAVFIITKSGKSDVEKFIEYTTEAAEAYASWRADTTALSLQLHEIRLNFIKNLKPLISSTHKLDDEELEKVVSALVQYYDFDPGLETELKNSLKNEYQSLTLGEIIEDHFGFVKDEISFGQMLSITSTDISWNFDQREEIAKILERLLKYYENSQDLIPTQGYESEFYQTIPQELSAYLSVQQDKHGIPVSDIAPISEGEIHTVGDFATSKFMKDFVRALAE